MSTTHTTKPREPATTIWIVLLIALVYAPLSACDDGPSEGPAVAGDTGPDASVLEVVINEVDCRGREWIELSVVSADGGDLVGWSVTDDPTDESRGHILPTGSTATNGDFLVIYEEDGDTPGFGFGIGCGSDRVTLLRPDGSEADGVDIPELVTGQSWGRLPDATGSFELTAQTPGAPNQAWDDPTERFFDPHRVGRIDLTVGNRALESLDENPYEWVAASFQYTDSDGDELESITVGLRLKGRWGSLRPVTDKPAFKVDLNRIESDGELFGLRELTLNNLVQDPTMLREATVYHLFRYLDVPAPRVGYIELWVNDEAYGLYANVETPNSAFLQRWYADTTHLYEGSYGVDVDVDGLLELEVDEGDDDDRTGLLALIEALDGAAEGGVYEATRELVDWDEVLRMIAVEVWSGHWDGYAPTINNYFLHEDGDGRFSLLPWGADQAFSTDWPWHVGAGRLFRMCMEDADCQDRYDAVLLDLLDALDRIDLDDYIESLAESIRTAVVADPRRPYDAVEVFETVEATREFIEWRTDQLRELMPCLRDEVTDGDGDGFVCDLDCNDEDSTIHVGATELCDGIDQDCTGVADDTDDCPDCTEVSRGPHNYAVCTRGRPVWLAFDHCWEQEMGPVIFDTPEEEAWLYEQAQSVDPNHYWTGLINPEDWPDGEFVWWNGWEPAYTNWHDDHPTGNEEQRCVALSEHGQWASVECWHSLPVLCEALCDVGDDEDRDGYDRCGEDCDDGDDDIHPNAEEICGDGIDQDCTGVADDSPSCD